MFKVYLSSCLGYENIQEAEKYNVYGIAETLHDAFKIIDKAYDIELGPDELTYIYDTETERFDEDYLWGYYEREG